MKNIIYSLILLAVVSCSSNKTVYWCGDHECESKEEKEAYFAKTMTIEIKNIDESELDNDYNLEKAILESQRGKRKKFKKRKLLTKKNKIEKKKDKTLTKQLKKDEKLRKKNEKYLAKQAKKEEKLRLKSEKELAKKLKKQKKKSSKKKLVKNNDNAFDASKNVVKQTNNFNELIKNILNRNSVRPYPDINDIPN